MKQLFLKSALLASSVTAMSQSLDPSFGYGGKIFSEGSREFDYYQETAKVAPNGAIYTLGTNYYYYKSDFILRKFTKDGLPDPTFSYGEGGQGEYVVNINDFDYASDFLIDEDGNIVFAGYTTTSEGKNQSFVVKIDSMGNYISGGYLLSSSVPGDFKVTGLAKLGSDYVVSGYSANENNFVVTKINSHGGAINEFGNNSIVSIDFNQGGDFCKDVMITDAGDVLLAGNTSTGGGLTMFAAALVDGTTGALKTNFGNQGKLTIKVSSNGSDAVANLLKLPNGKILINGHSRLPLRSVVALASFDAQTGALDKNFDYDGKRVIFLSGNGDYSTDATVYNGQLYLSCTSVQYNYEIKPAIVKILPNGSNDNSFGNMGVLLVNEPASVFTYLAFQGNKPIISTNSPKGGYLLMRLNPLPVASASRRAGVSVALESEALSVYPNPAVDKVSCTIAQELMEEGASVEVINMYGATVIENIPIEGNSIELSVASLEAGVYSAKVTTTNGKLVGVSKFVVQP